MGDSFLMVNVVIREYGGVYGWHDECMWGSSAEQRRCVMSRL